jgi:hypothetical protein
MSNPDELFALLGPLLSKHTRDQWKRLATMKKHREVLHSRLEYDSFDPRYERVVEPKDVGQLIRELRRLGAGERCTVIPMVRWFPPEPWEAPFVETLETLLGTSSLLPPGKSRHENNIVVACRPGRLAYMQVDEVYRKVIHRPN